MVKKLIIFVSILSFNIFACETGSAMPEPFVIEVNANAYNGLTEYKILSPLKQGEIFLSNVFVEVDGYFISFLDIIEDREYSGKYYSSTLFLSSQMASKAKLKLTYDAMQQDRSVRMFCGEQSVHPLIDLIKR